MSTQTCKAWYEASYKLQGIYAQRTYPNEELCRFIGRNYSSYSLLKKNNVRCLEVGCGSGANLWMLAEQGFQLTGLDISPASLDIARQALARKNLIGNVNLVESCMTTLPFKNNSFNLIIDCFSSYCLPSFEFTIFLAECFRVLESGSKLFFYTPSKSSDAFLNPGKAEMIDSSTLSGIVRETAPFYGNRYPFRFESPSDFLEKISRAGFLPTNLEIVSKTYNNQSEKFDWISCEASKPF